MLSEFLPCDFTVLNVKMFHKDSTGAIESHEIAITVLNRFEAEIDISCEGTNCDATVNPTRRVQFRAFCTNCVNQLLKDSITYHWVLTQPVGVNLVDITGTSGVRNAALVILEHSLESSQSYGLKVTGECYMT